MKPCRFVYNPSVSASDVKRFTRENDEEFDDEDLIDLDADDPFDVKRKIMKSDFQKLICSLVPLANNAQEHAVNKEAVGAYVEMAFKTIAHMLTGYEKFTHMNTHSYGLSCLGLDIMGPKFSVSDSKFNVQIKLDASPKHKLDN